MLEATTVEVTLPVVEPSVDEVGTVLEKAADALEESGWCRHRLLNGEGQMCLYGAINLVEHGNPGWVSGWRQNPLLKAINKRLYSVLNRPQPESLDRQCWDLVDWNNHEAADGQEVVRVLREASARND